MIDNVLRQMDTVPLESRYKDREGADAAVGTLFASSWRSGGRLTVRSLIKVSLKPFQRLAESRDSVSGRAPQSAKLPSVRRTARGNRTKRSGGAFWRGGSPAIEGSPKRIEKRFAVRRMRQADGSQPSAFCVCRFPKGGTPLSVQSPLTLPSGSTTEQQKDAG